MWSRLRRVDAGVPVLELDDARTQCRILDDDSHDDELSRLCLAVQAEVEGPKGLGLALTTQTWRGSLDAFPCAITIPLRPVSGVTGITYVDPDGEEQTLSPSVYEFDLDAEPFVIRPAQGQSWPATRCKAGAVKVTFTAGFGAAADVPEDLRGALLLMLEAQFDGEAYPPAVEAVLDRYRVPAIG